MRISSDHHQADLHFHLLPGVDDGPPALPDSVELARSAMADGTTLVVATAHVRDDHVTDVTTLGDRVAEVRGALEAVAVELEIRCGGELGHEMVGRLGQSELDAIAQGPPGGRWLLVEAPFGSIDECFHAATTELRDRGFGVVIAHPERSGEAGAGLDGDAWLGREVAAGSVVQLNAMSLAGRHGPAAEEAAYRLIASGCAAVVGSDAHGPSRPAALGLARRCMIRSGVPASMARALTGSGPLRLLARGIRSRHAVPKYAG